MASDLFYRLKVIVSFFFVVCLNHIAQIIGERFHLLLVIIALLTFGRGLGDSLC